MPGGIVLPGGIDFPITPDFQKVLPSLMCVINLQFTAWLISADELNTETNLASQHIGFYFRNAPK